jgi:predicted acyltransferase
MTTSLTETAPHSTAPQPANSERLLSIDALRGFDMFWIIGGDGIAAAIGKLSGNAVVLGVTAQVSDHMPWAGFRYYDMIFPLFLFIIGATLPFSIGKRMEQGASRRKLIGKILSRTAILIALGLVNNGILEFKGWDHTRFFGVLQRQGFGYCVAAILFVTTKPKTQAIIFITILLGYWGVLALVPVPGGHGPYNEWGNVPNYVDRLFLLPSQMYEKYGDPEGPVSMIPAVCTALLGLFTGRWLKSDREGEKKAMGLALAGLVCLALGLAWAPVLPVIKKIWTSSYVLVAGGFSMELLALFYWVIDVKGIRKWTFPFVVIGMNSITIYMATCIVPFERIAGFFMGGIAKAIPQFKDLIMAIAVVVVEWLLLYFLYRKRVFLRV